VGIIEFKYDFFGGKKVRLRNESLRQSACTVPGTVRSSKLCSFKTMETLCLHASKLHALRSARDVIIQGDMRACAATGINSLLCLQ
jgi:hypothetical protein